MLNEIHMEFSKKYFQKMYPKDGYIDGDFNAREHANYLKALFDLMEIEGKSLIDFGFGKGELLYRVSKVFDSEKVEAVDVSDFAHQEIKKKAWSKEWKLHHKPIHEISGRGIFDLGLCNSVLQYVDDDLVEVSLQRMAEKTKFLYFHVPTSEDYLVLKKVLDFKDPYAKQRPKAFYEKFTAKYFTVVAWGVLESKFNGRKGTPFTDSFYRT
jgi:ubiquinone/menaquinone biosynthesis C-methylase UbiE